MKNNQARRGYTLIEVLVTLSIISLLIALVLPAIQEARESSRALKCRNNLKQIGIGLHSYHSVIRYFPQEINDYSHSGAGAQHLEGRPELCSALTRILPYMDQLATFDSINYSVEFYPVSGYSPNPANYTAYSVTIDTFLCPSDRTGKITVHANNYRGNQGVGPALQLSSESPDSGNGFFSYPELVNESMIRDGLSFTAAFSERSRGSGDDLKNGGTPEQDFGDLGIEHLAAFRDSDYALGWCRVAADTNFPAFTRSGYTWFLAGRGTTSYCHAQEPNGPIPDAFNISTLTGKVGIATARSWHHGGVNVLMADGSVRFVHETMARAVWRGLGTRNGGEIEDSY